VCVCVSSSLTLLQLDLAKKPANRPLDVLWPVAQNAIGFMQNSGA